MTRVVNLRAFRGRPLPDDVVRVDRRSPWGNPYRITAAQDRSVVIALYRDWLAARLAEDPGFLEPLRGKQLACWCAPEPCHGDVIAEFVP